jgi:hypothetical protein
MNLRIIHFTVLAVVIGASAAQAQELPTFIGGEVMFSMQPSRDVPFAGPSVAPTGVGGNAVGLASEIGQFLSPALSIAFEFNLPSRFESVQDYRSSGIRDNNRHRDVTLSGLIGYSLHSRKAHVRFAGGPSFVREDTVQRTSYPMCSFPFNCAYGLTGEKHLTRWTNGLTYGVDLALDLNPHVSIVPAVRMFSIWRTPLRGTFIGHLELSSFVIRPGVGVRASF